MSPIFKMRPVQSNNGNMTPRHFWEIWGDGCKQWFMKNLLVSIWEILGGPYCRFLVKKTNYSTAGNDRVFNH